MRQLMALAWVVTLGTCSAQSSRTLFGSYFGGIDFEYGNAIATGPGGDIWFAGTTLSRNLPVVNASQSQCGGGSSDLCHDGFLVRLSADGRTVRFATYFGGPANDAITALRVDPDGYAYVVGSWGDAALAARFSPEGTPLWRVALGEAPETRATAVAFDDDGNLYLTGQTSSTRFPTTERALFPTAGAPSCQVSSASMVPVDAFVVKISVDGRVLFSTYIAGNGNDYGGAIAVDSLRRVFVGGGTTSTDLPMMRPIQDRHAGRIATGDLCAPGDAFVLQLDADGSSVRFGTLLGGGGNDEINSLLAEPNGLLTAIGATNSGPGFPLTTAARPLSNSFVARIDATTGTLLHSQHIRPQAGRAVASTAGFAAGGVGSLFSLRMADWQVRDLGGVGAFIQGAAPGPGGSVLAIGSASATQDFFRPVDAFQQNSGGLTDAFVMAVTQAIPEAVTLNAASYSGPDVAPNSIATAFHAEGEVVRVEVNAREALILSAAPGQTSFVVPDAQETGTAEVILRNDAGAELARGAVRIEPVAPAIFTANADGRGAPAAQVIRVDRSTGTPTNQNPFECGNAGACTPAAVAASDATAESVLVLYGTGLRSRTALSSVVAFIYGESLPVDYAGPQPEFHGLDHVNLRLPATLQGRGLVSVVVSVDGRLANAVRLHIL